MHTKNNVQKVQIMLTFRLVTKKIYVAAQIYLIQVIEEL